MWIRGRLSEQSPGYQRIPPGKITIGSLIAKLVERVPEMKVSQLPNSALGSVTNCARGASFGRILKYKFCMTISSLNVVDE